MKWSPDKSFKSVSEALGFIQDQFCFRHRESLWLPSESGLLLPRDGPPFIFRGECGGFETTVASKSRPQTFLNLSQEDIWAWDRLFRALCKRFMLAYDYNLNELQAKALLQHYGLPTELIDFTWRGGHAMAFAGAGDAEFGRICVMPIGQKAASPLLADFSGHPWAHRAQRQRALGVIMPTGYEDLKSPKTRDRFGLTWIEFRISGPDREFLTNIYNGLTCLANDPSGGFVRHHIIEYVEAYGKLSPNLTKWILDRQIPMTPRCYKVQGFESSDVIVTNAPPAEFGPYDTELEKKWTRRYLSREHPDSSWSRMDKFTWPRVLGTIVPDPRTFHGLSLDQAAL